MARGKFNHWWRRGCETILDALLCKGSFARLSYRHGWHGSLSVTQYTHRHTCTSNPKHSTFEQLPPLCIAFLSDFHAGPSTCPQIFRDAIDVLKNQDISLLLLGGDFISHRAQYVDQLLPLLETLKPPLGKYAVFGNHDLWSDHDYIEAQLARAQVKFLVNQEISLPAPYQHVHLYGFDDPWTGAAASNKTFAAHQGCRLVLSHSPDFLHFLDANAFDLAFAGHTHAGQLARSNGKPWWQTHGMYSQRYLHGDFHIENNGRLLVGSGLGCSNLPLRINADPEILICELHFSEN